MTNTWDSAGQQITSQDSTGITSYVWDNDSRKTATQNPTGINLTNTLDGAGNRLVLADPYGRTTYTWDIQSRLTNILNPANEMTSISWDSLDREQKRVLGNGLNVSHVYDATGRETLLQNISAAGVAQAVFTNAYDALDRRLSVIELDNTRCSFSYDASSQIINEQRTGANAYNTTYQWDPLGNRLVENASGSLTTRTFDSANGLIKSVAPTAVISTFTVDAAGNQIGINTAGTLSTYTWSSESRLLSSALPDGTIQTNTYASDGLRRSKNVNGTVTKYTLDEMNVLLETDGSGALVNRYTTNPGYFGGLSSQRKSGVSSFYGFDSQGSTRILLAIGGSISDAYSYMVFGIELASGSGTSNSRRYVGREGYERDWLNWMNLNNRPYDAINGRFPTPDELGFDAGDWNRKRYVGNEPISASDPTGLSPSLSDPSPCLSPERCEQIAGVGPGSGSVIGVLFANCCADCTKSIVNSWWNTTWHDCNHMFAHCISCCFLTRFAGSDCASTAQGLQNRFRKGRPRNYPYGPDDRSECRSQACDSGIAGASSKSSCYDYCISKWPFDGPPNCSSKTGPKVDCKGQKITMPPFPPGCKSNM